MPEWPEPRLSPLSVVEASIQALQRGDGQRVWRFASPANKRATGQPRGGEGDEPPWIQRPIYTELPTYAPLVRCRRYQITGGLPIDSDRYRIRVRVECEGQYDPLEYVWLLSRQPLVRPACYEDDPTQAGRAGWVPGVRCRGLEPAIRRRPVQPAPHTLRSVAGGVLDVRHC